MSAVNSPQLDIILNTSVRSSLNSSLAIPNRPVCRSLFGHPDPRSSSYARDKVKEIQQQQNQKWNFDFVNETPLHTRLKWEPVAVESASSENQLPVPQAYACQGLPFIDSPSSSSSSTSSQSATNIESQRLYNTPLINASHHSSDRVPLLIVRPAPATAAATTNLPIR